MKYSIKLFTSCVRTQWDSLHVLIKDFTLTLISLANGINSSRPPTSTTLSIITTHLFPRLGTSFPDNTFQLHIPSLQRQICFSVYFEWGSFFFVLIHRATLLCFALFIECRNKMRTNCVLFIRSFCIIYGSFYSMICGPIFFCRFYITNVVLKEAPFIIFFNFRDNVIKTYLLCVRNKRPV